MRGPAPEAAPSVGRRSPQTKGESPPIRTSGCRRSPIRPESSANQGEQTSGRRRVRLVSRVALSRFRWCAIAATWPATASPQPMSSQACQSSGPGQNQGHRFLPSRGRPSASAVRSIASANPSAPPPTSPSDRADGHPSEYALPSLRAVPGSRIETPQSGITSSLIAAICQSQYRRPGDDRRIPSATIAKTATRSVDCQVTAQISLHPGVRQAVEASR